jgi:hypothetical protein
VGGVPGRNRRVFGDRIHEAGEEIPAIQLSLDFIFGSLFLPLLCSRESKCDNGIHFRGP